MPIYAYRCDACGFQKDCLQKLSDAPLKICPECGKDSFSKQLTSAGFQLKGSGWYATDFKGGGVAPKPAEPAAEVPVAASDAKPDTAPAKKVSDTKPATPPAP